MKRKALLVDEETVSAAIEDDLDSIDDEMENKSENSSSFAVLEHFEKMKRAKNSTKTIMRYNGVINRIIQWLQLNFPHCIVQSSTGTKIDIPNFSIKILKSYLYYACHWQSGKCRNQPDRQGQQKRFSTPDGIRSALQFYYRQNGFRGMPTDLYDEFHAYLQGFKKDDKVKQRQGKLDSDAKAVLSFDGYKNLAEYAQQDFSFNSHFHLYLLFGWNLFSLWKKKTKSVNHRHVMDTINCSIFSRNQCIETKRLPSLR